MKQIGFGPVCPSAGAACGAVVVVVVVVVAADMVDWSAMLFWQASTMESLCWEVVMLDRVRRRTDVIEGCFSHAIRSRVETVEICRA